MLGTDRNRLRQRCKKIGWEQKGKDRDRDTKRRLGTERNRLGLRCKEKIRHREEQTEAEMQREGWAQRGID